MNELDAANYQMLLLVEAMYRQIESTYKNSGSVGRTTMVRNVRDGYALMFMAPGVADEMEKLLKMKPDSVSDTFAFLAPIIGPIP